MMHCDAQLVRNRMRHALVASPAQDIANRFGRQAALAFEGQNAAVALFQPGFDIDRMERHG